MHILTWPQLESAGADCNHFSEGTFALMASQEAGSLDLGEALGGDVAVSIVNADTLFLRAQPYPQAPPPHPVRQGQPVRGQKPRHSLCTSRPETASGGSGGERPFQGLCAALSLCPAPGLLFQACLANLALLPPLPPFR